MNMKKPDSTFTTGFCLIMLSYFAMKYVTVVSGK